MAEEEGAPAPVTEAAAPAPEPEAPVELAAAGAEFGNPDQAAAAQKAAMAVQNKLNASALPIRQYLEASVVPILLQGMQAVVKERPNDPIEFLAAYLLKNKPSA